MVSWKEAADNHESVANDAFVIPMSSGRPEAGVPPSATTRRFSVSKAVPLDQLPGQHLGVARLEDGHPLEHLADDHLDVLVVDRHTLAAVDLLDLLHEVLLHPARTEDPQDLLGVDSADDELLPDLDVVALADEQPSPLGDRVADLLRAVIRDDHELAGLLGVLDLDPAGSLTDRGVALGRTRLEQLDHARETVRDVLAGDAAGVEGPHRQLGAGLADGLRGDDADRFTDVHELAGGHRAPVALRAGADLALAGQDAAHLQLLEPGLDEGVDERDGDVVPGRRQGGAAHHDVVSDRP